MKLSFTVIICAYTQERWELLVRAVKSVLAQNRAPGQVILCIDHNPELAARCRAQWSQADAPEIIENRYPGRLGSARNTAVEWVSSDLIAFLDDDAVAPADWLEHLAAMYEAEPEVHAIGGGPVPEFSSPLPSWFPREFYWVFGCAYAGLPTERAPVGRMIGACMSARASSIRDVGGFHSDNHDDMDLTHRLIARFGYDSVVYDPTIQIFHHVSAERVSWAYFWRRCFSVNRGKVLAFRDLAHAGNQQADLAFVRQTLLGAVPRYFASPRDGGPLRALATIAGIGLAGLGNIVGRLSLIAGATEPALTRGLDAAAEIEAPRLVS